MEIIYFSARQHFKCCTISACTHCPSASVSFSGRIAVPLAWQKGSSLPKKEPPQPAMAGNWFYTRDFYFHQGLGTAVGGNEHLQPRKCVVSWSAYNAVWPAGPVCCGPVRSHLERCVQGMVSGWKRFRLDSRRKFLTVRVMGLWNQMPREVVNTRSVEVFKFKFHGALSNLVYFKVYLSTAGDLELGDL